jgi:hypothetical protein
VRLSEGTKKSRPGSPRESSWSKRRNPYIRNVEAVGSNPITSTDESPVTGLKVGSPKVTYFAGIEASFRSGCANIMCANVAGWNRAMDIL